MNEYDLLVWEKKFRENRDLAGSDLWGKIEHVYTLEETVLPGPKTKVRHLLKLYDTNNGWQVINGLDFLLPVKVGQTIIEFLNGGLK